MRAAIDSPDGMRSQTLVRTTADADIGMRWVRRS
jgi:hypothetical protein